MSDRVKAMAEWKPIPGYPNYLVSDMGEVWSKYKRGVLLSCKTPKGYLRVNLRSRGKGSTISVHVLVLLAFIGKVPEGHQSAHLNGNPSDNRLSNLVHVTPKENCRHRKIHGTEARGERMNTAKLTEVDVCKMRLSFVPDCSMNGVYALSKRYRVTYSAALCAITGKTWTHLPGARERRAK